MRKLPLNESAPFLVVGVGLEHQYAVLDARKNRIVGQPFRSHADATADAVARTAQLAILQRRGA